jgi:hypothetical protein
MTRFRLGADFRPVWTWNTKQLFVFVTLDYNTPDGVRLNCIDGPGAKLNFLPDDEIFFGAQANHSVFVWDAIIQDKEKASFSIKKQIPDYFLVDLPDNLRSVACCILGSPLKIL